MEEGIVKRLFGKGFSAKARPVLLASMVLATWFPATAGAADLNYGKPGDPVNLVVGYQPYYTEAWSGIVVAGLDLWKKYLPAGSKVEFRAGIQGAVIVNEMLAGKESIGYLGDTPAIVAASKRKVADIRIVAAVGSSHDQCNVFYTRKDAPDFSDQIQAIKWFDGKTVAVPQGSCTDRFARAAFLKENVKPADYLNQNIEVITSGFRTGKLDATVVWEPIGSRLVLDGLAKRVASGNAIGEDDGAFLTFRADLIKQRPDIVKAWLNAELDAELYIADSKNAATVVRLVKERTTGFTERQIWQALYGTYPERVGGSDVRVVLPFGFSDTSNNLIEKATKFLYSIKTIGVPKLEDDAVLPQFTADILKERSLTVPVATIKAQPDSAAVR
jgi:NitT/TauT family transport system substrate-binding protein